MSAPVPQAGHRQEGDEEHNQTDEERILEEIGTTQKDLVDAMTGDTYDDALTRAPHEKKLGRLEFQHRFLTEKKRLARELSKFEEIHGVPYSEPCLICLDDIYIHASDKITRVLFCCGGFVCITCAQDIKESGLGFYKCPLCRELLPKDGMVAEETAQKMKLAERGVSWAQMCVGKGMIFGEEAYKKREKTGLKWLNKAAAQDYPCALYMLCRLYRDGLASTLVKSQGKSKELLLQSANLGHALANADLADCYFHGTEGFQQDRVEAYFRASVAFALDDTNGWSAKLLGYFHHSECNIPEPSIYLACYYTNIAANKEKARGEVCYHYGQTLVTLTSHLHDSTFLPGSDVTPAVFFWLRKSRDLGDKDAKEELKKLEVQSQSKCDYCFKEALPGVKFKQCSKCKAHWYCSKECQVEAWRVGHKKDCKRARIVKFEDYLNAE